MTDSPSYWRLNTYQQTAIVTNARKYQDRVDLRLTIADIETQYIGNLFEIADVLKQDKRLVVDVLFNGDRIQLSTYGTPFIIDTPTPDIQISVDIDEDFVLVFAPVASEHKRVHAYHQELLKAIEGEALYPASTDSHLYPTYRKYYQAVFATLGIGVDCDRLSSESRHAFLITTEPFLHPQTKTWMAGTCGLAQLMGFSIPDEIKEIEEEDRDDTLLSAVAGALLMFKNRAGWVVSNYSLVELSTLIRIASERVQAANDEMDKRMGKTGNAPSEPLPETLPVADSDKWLEVKDDVVDKLNGLHIPLPKNF